MTELVEEGYWWYPESPEIKYPGAIRYTEKDGIRLSISAIQNPRSFSVRRSAEMMHGTTRKGDKYTLLRGFETSSGVSSQDLGLLNKKPYQVGYKELFFNYALKGAHSNKPYENIKVRSIHLVPRYINRWFFDSALNFERTERFEELRISYNPDLKQDYSLNDGTVFSLHRRLNSYPFAAGWDGELELKEETLLSVDFAKEEYLDDVYDYVSAIEDLFTILFSKRSICESLSLELDQVETRKDGDKVDTIPCYVEWVLRPNRNIIGEPPHPGDIFFKFKEIQGFFGEVIDNWVSKSRQLRQVRQLYLSAIYSSEQYLESSVLNLSKALEVYHRRFHDGILIEDEMFKKKVLPSLVDAIPDDLDKVVKEVICSRLAFVNEFSLNKRLKILIDLHSSVLNLFDLDQKKIIRDIVQARNHFTHYTLENPESVLSFDALCVCLDFLRLLCDICFMSEMGFKEEDIKKNISNSQTFKWSSLRFKS